MAKKRFLTGARRNWLASLFKNATLVLLAGVVGGEVFMKVEVIWRFALVGAIAALGGVGLYFAAENNPEKEE